MGVEKTEIEMKTMRLDREREREKKSFSVSERLSASERGNEIDTETGGQRWIERTKDREKKRQSDREIESNTD